MKFVLTLFAIALTSNMILAQNFDWTNTQQRNVMYPNSKFLTGYVQYKNQQNQTEEQFVEKLKGYAQTDLVQGVQTHIESASVLNTREENDNFSELFMLSTTSSTGMTIAGLQFETKYDKKTKIGYAFAYANREVVLENYKNTLTKTKNDIQQKIDQANSMTGQTAKQLLQLNACYPYFRNAEEAQGIMYALKPGISVTELQLSEFKALKTEMENIKAGLEKSTAVDINEAASLLVFSLKSQIPTDDFTVRLINLSYHDTKMGSTFSRRFSKTLEQKLSTEAGINVVSDISSTDQPQISNFLTGTYWEEGNDIRIILVLKDTKVNKTIASAETKLSQSWITQNGINYKPENFQEAYANMKAFKTDEVTGGGLQAEIWTNKGDQNLIYTEGDNMKLFIRANLECYIRVVYHLADGSRVLLVDNYYISSDKVNTVYELPYEFECSEPYGIETLQLNAQTEPFAPLNITKQEGYDFINENLNAILVNTRGMKKVTTEVLKAEKRVVITTMKN